MELLQGVTLRDELKQRKRLSPSRIVEVLRGVCMAVGSAHQRELIHRDLKPENIFIARAGDSPGDVVKVLDFGIAKYLPSEGDAVPTRAPGTETGVLVGSPAYMSPEQLNREDLNILWDLWALGVLTYEALTGALPFPTSGGNWPQCVLSGSFTPVAAHLGQPAEQWQSFFGQVFPTIANNARSQPRTFLFDSRERSRVNREPRESCA